RAGAQNGDEHDLLAVEDGSAHAGEGRLDGGRLGGEVAGHLVGEKHADLGDEGAELGRARLLAPQQGGLVLDQGRGVGLEGGAAARSSLLAGAGGWASTGCLSISCPCAPSARGPRPRSRPRSPPTISAARSSPSSRATCSGAWG